MGSGSGSPLARVLSRLPHRRRASSPSGALVNVRALVHRPAAVLATLACLVAAGSGATADATQAAPAVSAPVTVTKVLVFVEENHSLAQMASAMPFVYGL